MSLLIPALLLVLTIPLIIGLIRINELFVLRVSSGELRVVRGKLPPALLRDIGDVVRSAGVDDAELRAVVEDGRATVRLRGEGLPGFFRQRLLNTLAQWPLAKIRNASRSR